MFGVTIFGRRFIDTGSMDACIEMLMNQENPDISMLLAYDKEWVTVQQHEDINYILGQVAKSRQLPMEALQEQLLERAKEVFGKIREDIEKLGNTSMDARIIETQLDTLQTDKTLTQLAHKCYRISDEDCSDVIAMESGNEAYIHDSKKTLTFNPKYKSASYQTVAERHQVSTESTISTGSTSGSFLKKLDAFEWKDYQHEQKKCQDEKRRRMKEFEIAVLRKGLDAYYERLSTACDVVFEAMGSAIQAPKEGQNTDIQHQMLENLFSSCKTVARQMIEADKAQLQTAVNAGEYTPDIFG